MPKFIDHHPMPAMPPAMAKQIADQIKAGKADRFGVKGLNVFAGTGEAWCLSDGPNADAVCKSHEAMGIKLDKGHVSEVTVLA